MQTFVLIAELAVMLGSAAFAHRHGDQAERLGAIWFGLNMIASSTAYFLGFDTALVHLIEDGVFALGLLPLAMIFVSYWIGLVTLVAAGLFGLKAVYLLGDLPLDNTYAWINNGLWLSVPLIFLAAGGVNLVRKRSRLRPLAACGAPA